MAKHNLTLGVLLALACSNRAPTAVVAPRFTAASPPSVPMAPVPTQALASRVQSTEGNEQPVDFGGNDAARPLQVIEVAPVCSRADWTPQKLVPLLSRGKGAKRPLTGQRGARGELLDGACSDMPSTVPASSLASTVVDGVRIQVLRDTPAGASGRGWQGSQCELELSLADGSGVPVALGSDLVPPFNTVRALVRSGSAVWLNLGFNGYAREFPKGGNRIVAVDLCDGRVVWQSKDSVSNGGLLLLDDYLITAYGFTAERRYVLVLDPHSGSVVQQLPIIENVCPSMAWAPNWQPGERCDAPGQTVGAATDPRIEDGVFMVDTNTGSSMFHFSD